MCEQCVCVLLYWDPTVLQTATTKSVFAKCIAAGECVWGHILSGYGIFLFFNCI